MSDESNAGSGEAMTYREPVPGSTWSRVLPQMRLSDQAYRVRHRALRWILWLQVPILALVAVFHDGIPGGSAATAGMPPDTGQGGLVIRLMLAALAGCLAGGSVLRGRRAGAAVVSLGLLLSAALLVSIGGGRTDLHFAFFLMIGLISLYQDWLPLLMSVVLVTVHHLVMGTLAPTMLYSDGASESEPVRYAVLHAGFVLGTCAIQVAYWGFAGRAQRETDEVREQGEQSLRRTAERFEALVQDSSDVTLVVDRAGRIVSASTAVQRIMGYRPADLAGTDHALLIHPDDRALLAAGPGPAGNELRAEVRARQADGGWHWHDVTMRDLSGHPAVVGWVVNHRDVTERRMFQERLVYEASHDALTGLANRAELLRVLEQELAGPRAGRAVLYLDLDGFKQVNDSYGHEAGDALLISVARSLQRSVLGSDTVGRLGGDEFAVVLTKIDAFENAVAVANRILDDMARPVPVNGRLLLPRVSIGIALATPAGLQTDELLHRADTAMYHAKRDGTTSWRVYVEGMHDPGTTVTTPEEARSTP
jgi:diguanylate cyclase (GGDEF)-like protein/PAS domain S-box-containing protein